MRNVARMQVELLKRKLDTCANNATSADEASHKGNLALDRAVCLNLGSGHRRPQTGVCTRLIAWRDVHNTPCRHHTAPALVPSRGYVE